MFDLWNFHDSWVLVQHFAVWMIIVLAFGIWCGWTTSAPEQQ